MKRPAALLVVLALLLGLCVWAPGALTRYQEARALALQAEASLETTRVAHTVAWGNAALAWALAAVALVAVVVAASAVGYAVWTARRAASGRKWASGPYAYWRKTDGGKPDALTPASSDPLETLVRLETLRLLRELRLTAPSGRWDALPAPQGQDDDEDDLDLTVWGF